jgi:signal transduction histidine kinase
VLANLLENAGKFATSSVQLEVRPVGDRVELVVEDDGSGIAPEDLPHVFERL